QMFETSDEWIVERTGIRERRVGGTTVGLSIESGRRAIEMAGIDPLEIDALVLATTTPDRAVPASSAAVQNELGLRCGAFDVNADGSAERFLYAEVGGFVQMEGKEVFRRAVRIMVDSATKTMDHAGVTADQIAMVVPHQANIRIIESACAKLGIPMEKAATV